MNTRSILLCDKLAKLETVYSAETIGKLSCDADLDPHPYRSKDVRENPGMFSKVQFIFSTWGMPAFTEKEIRAFFPSLRAVFYAAGSVQSFARPFLACGVRVYSAWAANAVPVVQYTVSAILLADKGFFRSAALMRRGDYRASSALSSQYPGNYESPVGIIGAGMIGSRVATELRRQGIPVKVYDPFLSDERAKALGVEKCPLDELFSTCGVVSNHLANNEQTKGMIGEKLLSSMPPYATFLNTGRGAQVREDDLIRVLTRREDLTAILDVTDPEPPEVGSPFYSLENCVLTPHIAGSKGDETHRMAEYMYEEWKRLTSGEKTLWEVTPSMLATMA